MKLVVVIIAAATLAVAAHVKTAQEGIYTDAQATRGEAIYAKSCASCHGASLEGSGQAPPLAGEDFATEWDGQPLSDLFERIRTTMPGDAPGTLKPSEVADVLAFVLKKGGHTGGSVDLPADATALKEVRFRKTS